MSGRCYCCDKVLNPFEMTRKSVSSGDYIGMCNKCYATIKEDLISEERYDLYDGDDEQTTEEYDQENYD